MELSTERRFVKSALLVSILCGTMWLAVWSFLGTLDSQNDIILGSKIVISGFGEIDLYNPQKVGLFSTNTYQDTQLGFQISKPNNDWDIHSTIDDMNPDELTSLQSKGFLGGIYVEKNHERQFMLTVFDIQKEKFSLHEFVDQQISLIESQKNISVEFEQVSPDNDWALFAVEASDGTIPYGEQLLFFKDNILYMLQYSGESPQTLDIDQKNDFKFIMDSFEVI